jgi:RNA polymerase sigma factor (sigma-70 family)
METLAPFDTVPFQVHLSVIESPSDELAGSAVPDKKNWTTTASAFQRLLHWLDGKTNSDGQKYLEMRRRLVAYFERKSCLTPDDLADETLNRVARRLEEEDISEAEDPAKYCYIVARFVFLEHLRSSRREDALANDLMRSAEATTAIFDQARDEENIMLSCLEECIKKLEPESRQIIHGYYVGKEREKIQNRRSLAQTLGITPNALSIRACRIRARLEKCVRECCS